MERIFNGNKEWKNGEFPQIHGLVYSLKDGILKDLDSSINSLEAMRPVYQLHNKPFESK
jgi:carbonic anhydrase